MATTTSVTWKIATSLDGRIALEDGTSQWITGTESRARAHQMRAEHDAVIVGIGTVLADDPLLTARTVPLPEQQPARIVVDSRGRTPLDGRLMQSTSLGRVIIATDVERSGDLLAAGADMWPCGIGDRGGIDLEYFVKRCGVEGIEKLFLEGGGKLAASFIAAGLVDRIEWFRAPLLIGGDGIPALGTLGLGDMNHAPRWHMVATERIGDDTLETYEISGRSR